MAEHTRIVCVGNGASGSPSASDEAKTLRRQCIYRNGKINSTGMCPQLETFVKWELNRHMKYTEQAWYKATIKGAYTLGSIDRTSCVKCVSVSDIFRSLGLRDGQNMVQDWKENPDLKARLDHPEWVGTYCTRGSRSHGGQDVE